MRRSRLDTRLGKELAIGQEWRSRIDGSVWKVRQIHRPDAGAEIQQVAAAETGTLPVLRPGESTVRRLITFADLRQGYDRLVAFEDGPARPEPDALERVRYP